VALLPHCLTRTCQRYLVYRGPYAPTAAALVHRRLMESKDTAGFGVTDRAK
jgi:hypothetical protein